DDDRICRLRGGRPDADVPWGGLAPADFDRLRGALSVTADPRSFTAAGSLTPPASRLTILPGMNKQWGDVATARHDRSDVVPDPARVIEPADRIPWIRPILDVDESLLADIHAALSSGRVTNDGPKLREFERQIATYLGTE